jgi:2'-5' RNA ligase
VTIRFLGSTTALQRDRILEFLDEHLAVEPFTVSFGGLGAFPKPSRATVLWLAIERGGEQLAAMAEVSELAAQDAGFEPEGRPFHAHLTLARIRPPANVVPLIERVPRFPLSMEVSRLTLYRSHLDGDGATYEAIEAVEL